MVCKLRKEYACAVEMKLMEVNTIEQILDREKEMVLSAPVRYGKYYETAMECSLLMTHFLESINQNRAIFASFLSQVKKHLTLALFSAVRLHENQSMMNIRYALEAGVCAAYAIAKIDKKNFADTDNYGILKPSKLFEKRYDWLKEEYLYESNLIKGIKDKISNSSAHANIISVQNNFQYDEEKSMFYSPFFDIDDELYVKTNLWTIGNVAIILMGLFHNVNSKLDVLKFVDSFPLTFNTLCEKNEALAAEAMSTYKNALQIENARKDA